jgi:hypothetical protein
MAKRSINRQPPAATFKIEDKHCRVQFHYGDASNPGLRCTASINADHPGQGPVVKPRTVKVPTSGAIPLAVLDLTPHELQQAARLYVERSIDKAIESDPHVSDVTEEEEAAEAAEAEEEEAI